MTLSTSRKYLPAEIIVSPAGVFFFAKRNISALGRLPIASGNQALLLSLFENLEALTTVEVGQDG